MRIEGRPLLSKAEWYAITASEVLHALCWGKSCQFGDKWLE